MATSTTPAETADALASLEERILRAVQLVSQLRQEKEAVEQQVQAVTAEKEAALGTVSKLELENLQLQEDLETLRAERKDVRGRIEKLLGQLDLLAG
jgi:predicted nuclease with TOPRIM domain